MFCMSGSPNLNSFRDRGQVAVQLVSCGVLPPGLVEDCTQHSCVIATLTKHFHLVTFICYAYYCYYAYILAIKTIYKLLCLYISYYSFISYYAYMSVIMSIYQLLWLYQLLCLYVSYYCYISVIMAMYSFSMSQDIAIQSGYDAMLILSRLKLVWIHILPSPWLVVSPKLKKKVC